MFVYFFLWLRWLIWPQDNQPSPIFAWGFDKSATKILSQGFPHPPLIPVLIRLGLNDGPTLWHGQCVYGQKDWKQPHSQPEWPVPQSRGTPLLGRRAPSKTRKPMENDVTFNVPFWCWWWNTVWMKQPALGHLQHFGRMKQNNKIYLWQIDKSSLI